MPVLITGEMLEGESEVSRTACKNGKSSSVKTATKQLSENLPLSFFRGLGPASEPSSASPVPASHRYQRLVRNASILLHITGCFLTNENCNVQLLANTSQNGIYIVLFQCEAELMWRTPPRYGNVLFLPANVISMLIEQMHWY